MRTQDWKDNVNFDRNSLMIYFNNFKKFKVGKIEGFI